MGRVLGRGLVGIAPFIVGFVVGDLIWFAVAATGLAVLAHQFAAIFTAVRTAGCCYLLYLAWRLWSAPGAPRPRSAQSAGSEMRGALFLARCR